MATVNIKNVIKTVQQFDGLSNVDSFCKRLQQAITLHKLNYEWVLLNFHLFISGEVENWWKWEPLGHLEIGWHSDYC